MREKFKQLTRSPPCAFLCVNFQVAWYKDTMQILPTDRISMDTRGAKHSLIIRSVIPTDFGNYSCVASNLLGKERRIVTLTGRPHPVVFQSPSSVSQWRDKYNISWTVKSVAPIEEYKLYYKPVVGPLTQHYDLQRMRGTYSSSSSSSSSVSVWRRLELREPSSDFERFNTRIIFRFYCRVAIFC